MLIVSDRNIPFVEEVFAELGTVRTMPAAQIDAAAVRDAEILLCRTTIKVGPSLLEGSKVRFVATATIGTDHMDLPWLEARGIGWASAPGSNADSVALWWACMLAELGRRRGTDPASLRVGVVGVGHVGKRIAALASALGVEPVLCDPPRARAEGGRFVSLDSLIERADLVSLHVPLSKDGPDATVNLMSAERIARLKPGAIVLNACRGEILDGDALRHAIAAGKASAVLDVFAGEPSPDPQLVAAATIATPHIAGHSLDGKVNGTDMVYRAACAFLGCAPTASAHALLPSLGEELRTVDALERSDAEVLHDALVPFYDIARDDAALREIVALPADQRGKAFRGYRDGYPVRREPRGVRIALAPRRTRIAAILGLLGVVVPTKTR